MQSKRQEIHCKIFLYALIFVVVTLPLNEEMNRLAVAILIANWILEGNFKQKLEFLRRNLLLWLFITFYLLHLIALVYTNNIHEGFFQLEKKLTLLTSPVILASSYRLNQSQIDRIFIFFLSSVVLASIICLGYAFHRNNYLETFHSPVWFYFSYYDLTEILNIQPNYLALFVGFSILILCYFLIENLTSYTALQKLCIALLIIYLIVFLLLLSGRTSIAATTIILFSGFIFFCYKQKMLIKGVLIFVISSLLLGTLIYQMPIIKERLWQTFGLEQNAVWISQMGDGKGGLPSVRWLKWKCAWEVIEKNPIIGIGPGDVHDALQSQYKKIDFSIAFEQKYNPHNQFLQTWVGLGVIGLVSLILCMLIPTIIAYKKGKYLYFSFVIFFALCNITESALERQLGIVFYSTFNSLFAFHFLEVIPKKMN